MKGKVALIGSYKSGITLPHCFLNPTYQVKLLIIIGFYLNDVGINVAW